MPFYPPHCELHAAAAAVREMIHRGGLMYEPIGHDMTLTLAIAAGRRYPVGNAKVGPHHNANPGHSRKGTRGCTMSIPERDPAERGVVGLFYRDWRPTRLGRIANRIAAWWSATGLPPSFQQTIEVRGRTSGKPRSNPIVIARVGGNRYLVSMLGPQSEWVKNVIAADGVAVLRHGRREQVRLVSVPAEERAPVLREYVRIATSGRTHFPLKPGAPLSEFAAIADRYPVFRINPAE